MHTSHGTFRQFRAVTPLEMAHFAVSPCDPPVRSREAHAYEGPTPSHGTIGCVRFSRENIAGGAQQFPSIKRPGSLKSWQRKCGAIESTRLRTRCQAESAVPGRTCRSFDTSQSSSIPVGEMTTPDVTSMGVNGGIGRHCQSTRGLIGKSRIAGLIGGNNVAARPGKAS